MVVVAWHYRAGILLAEGRQREVAHAFQELALVSEVLLHDKVQSVGEVLRVADLLQEELRGLLLELHVFLKDLDHAIRALLADAGLKGGVHDELGRRDAFLCKSVPEVEDHVEVSKVEVHSGQLLVSVDVVFHAVLFIERQDLGLDLFGPQGSGEERH